MSYLLALLQVLCCNLLNTTSSFTTSTSLLNICLQMITCYNILWLR